MSTVFIKQSERLMDCVRAGSGDGVGTGTGRVRGEDFYRILKLTMEYKF
jgi:hypothetical protein